MRDAIIEGRADSTMGHDRLTIRVAENGRMSIPAKYRKLLGVEFGGLLVAELENGELRLRPIREVLAALQAEVRQYIAPGGPDLTDELIAERRAEAAREEAEP